MTEQQDRISELEFSVRALQYVRNIDHRELVESVQSCVTEIASLRAAVAALEGEISLLKFVVHQVLLRSEDTDITSLAQPASSSSAIDIHGLD